MPADHGYSQGMVTDPKLACICPEEFEHDGPCKNRVRPKHAKCPPCSSGWHFDGPCGEYVRKGGHVAVHSTQCDRCGWDSAEHVLPERLRRFMDPPAKTPRDP